MVDYLVRARDKLRVTYWLHVFEWPTIEGLQRSGCAAMKSPAVSSAWFGKQHHIRNTYKTLEDNRV